MIRGRSARAGATQDIYSFKHGIAMQYLYLNSQRIDLSNDIKYALKRNFKEEGSDREMKNNIFSIDFLTKISSTKMYPDI